MQESAGRDVAFLEVEPNALEWLGKRPLTPDLLEDRGLGNPQMLTAMTGCPTQTVDDPMITGKIVPAYISIGLIPIAAEDYALKVIPVPEADAPPDPQRDVFLDYCEEDARRIDTNERIELPTVGGMSGGAYYDFGQFVEGEFWRPDQLRFYAIQSSCNNRAVNPYVRGTQIVHWAKLVADHYPALRQTLRSRFPRVDSL